MDIRAQRTRELLRVTLEELLEEKNIEDIAVSEVCERSTVRRATFYRHFEDKYAFFEWYLASVTERFLTELGDTASCDDLRTYASLMHRKLINFAIAHKGMMRHSLGRTAMAGSLDMMMGQIAEGIAERIAGQAAERDWQLKTSPQLISMFYAGGMMHTLRWWITASAPCPAEDLEHHATEFLMRYLEG